MPHGYSGTPLTKKLGIKDEFDILLYNQPAHYLDLLIDLPSSITFLKAREAESADFIHIFCRSFEELQKMASQYMDALKKDGMLWISWPKGKSSIETDLNRDIIREYVLGMGLVDVKVAAVDDDWSALKFVYRLKDR